MIVAVDENNGIGKNNQLLCHLPADLHHFKKTTMGKPIIMGKNTFLSIGKALPGRQNIVVCHSPLPVTGITCVQNIDHALQIAKTASEIMVIGGATIYNQLLSKADRIYLTRIHHHFSADIFFPELLPWQWQSQVIGQQEADEKNAYAMTFYLYQRQE